MSFEPINIFSRRIDVRGVISVLRGVADQVTVEGAEDDWKRVIAVGRKRLLRKPARLVVGHQRDFYEGPNWAAQVQGLSDYFSAFPDVPRKAEILRSLRSVRFVLAFPECDLGIDGDDERAEWVYAICRHLDGVFFTPSSLRDASGRILISADGKYDPRAVLPATSETTDVITPPGSSLAGGDDDEESGAIDPPTAQRVARRALVLAAVGNRGLLENERESLDEPDEMRIGMLEWLQEAGAADEMEPDEWKALQRPVGTLDSRSMINAVWRLEGLGILLWALGRYTPPPDDELVAPGDLFDVVALGDSDSSRAFLETARLRSPAEISAMSKHLLLFHWRLRDFSLNQIAMDFVAFSKTSIFGEFDVSQFRIVDRDLALGGKPIGRADPELFGACRSAAQERHLAINWLSGQCSLYSETDTST